MIAIIEEHEISISETHEQVIFVEKIIVHPGYDPDDPVWSYIL